MLSSRSCWRRAWLHSYEVIYNNISISHQCCPLTVTSKAKICQPWFNKRFTEAGWSCLDITDYTLKKLMNLTSAYEMRSFKCMGGRAKRPYRKWFSQCVMNNALSATYACYCFSNLTRHWWWASRAPSAPSAWHSTCITSVVIALLLLG